MDKKERIIKKMKALVEEAAQKKDREFRSAIEELVHEGEEDAEYALVYYLTEPELSPETLIEIIRVAGYLQLDSFLIPLKKIIDTAQHSRVRQEAIISVSKFNDRRALNILSQALQKINNPMLQRTLNEEISRIKENNPILALLPRFKWGQKNPKTFNVTLQILKRILTPADATIFTKFLSSEDPLIQNGAFEILCITGDIFHDADILEFYQDRFEKIPCTAEPECEELYMLTHHIKQYLSRYQFLIEEQVPTLKKQFLTVNDIRAKQLLVSIICKSKQKESIDFTREIYHKETGIDLKTTIIKELSGNETAADFLFELYRSEEPLKEHIIESLLNIKQGLDYFVQHFFTLNFTDQELIVQKLPYAGQLDLVEFIKQIFQADIYRLKEILLTKVRETYEFSVKELLFAPPREREFFFMGDQYLDTITRLFPVTSVKKLLTKIASQDLSVTQTKKFLLKIEEVVPGDLIFNFKDKEFITTLFKKIIKSNNTELNVLFLGILKHIKTLDARTYQNIRESTNLFITQRQTMLTPKEKGELSRIKRHLRDLYQEIKRFEDDAAVLEGFLKKRFVDFELLREILIYHHMAVTKHKEILVKYLSQRLEKALKSHITFWTALLTEFPRVANLIKPTIDAIVDNNPELIYRELAQLNESLDNHPLRIVLIFKNRHLTAILREQFQEAAPDIPVEIDETNLKQSDTLLCDKEAFRDLILKTRMLPDKIYLFLEDLVGYSEFKAYNPKSFVQPFLFFRIVKEILQRFYL